MKLKKLLWLCAFASFLPLHSPGQAKADFSVKADQYIRPYVETNNFNGSVLVAVNGKIIFEKAYGYANIEFNVPNDQNTSYHLASVSKTFTAAAILILEQRKLLSTNDFISKYLPDFPSGNTITIHHLLSHTSGIPNVNDLIEYQTASLLHQTPESLIALFKDKPLVFQPGARYQYSNSNYNVLAFIIEKVSGKTYGDFLSENIFKPLHMDNTFHHNDAGRIIKNCSEGYASDGNFGLQKAAYFDWSSKTGNGSIVSTTHDLLAWDRALYAEEILTAESKKKMFTQYAGSGYGWYLGKRFDKDCIYMNGRSPGFCSNISRYPMEGLCIVVLENNYITTASKIGTDLAGIYFNQPIETPDLKLTKVKKEESNLIVGRYQFGADFYRPNFVMTITERDGFLYSDWGELISSKPFQFIQRDYWSAVSFTKTSDGKINAMMFDNFSGKKTD